MVVIHGRVDQLNRRALALHPGQAVVRVLQHGVLGRVGRPGRRRSVVRAVLGALTVLVVLASCGSEPPLLEQFPTAALQVQVPGATLSKIECDVDDFVIGGLGGPGASGDWGSPVAAADHVIETYKIGQALGHELIASTEVSPQLVTFTDIDGVPIADVKVEHLGDGWYASGFQACMSR